MIGRNVVLSLALVAMSPIGLRAQVAIAKEDVHLPTDRLDPQATSPCNLQRRHGYADLARCDERVSPRSNEEGKADGWVYSRYLKVVGGASVAAGRALPSGVASASASFHGCPNVGMSKGGKRPAAAIQALNLLKNRYVAPVPAQIDSAITLAAMLAPAMTVPVSRWTRARRSWEW